MDCPHRVLLLIDKPLRGSQGRRATEEPQKRREKRTVPGLKPAHKPYPRSSPDRWCLQSRRGRIGLILPSPPTRFSAPTERPERKLHRPLIARIPHCHL